MRIILFKATKRREELKIRCVQANYPEALIELHSLFIWTVHCRDNHQFDHKQRTWIVHDHIGHFSQNVHKTSKFIRISWFFFTPQATRPPPRGILDPLEIYLSVFDVSMLSFSFADSSATAATCSLLHSQWVISPLQRCHPKRIVSRISLHLPHDPMRWRWIESDVSHNRVCSASLPTAKSVVIFAFGTGRKWRSDDIDKYQPMSFRPDNNEYF